MEREFFRFRACDQETTKKRLPCVPKSDFIRWKFRKQLESCAHPEILLVDSGFVTAPANQFIQAAQLAFSNHYPLYLSPDIFWLLICQGLSEHVRQNQDYFRKHLVDFEGKETIQVRRDDFVKGNFSNPWDEVIPQFSMQATQRLKTDLKNDVTALFSTTGLKEQIAFDVCFLEMVSPYFDYEFLSLCGIPEFYLDGTVEDWTLLREKAESIKKYELNWWIESCLPLLDKILETRKGNVDKEFWNSFFKQDNQSGGPYLNGWLFRFFPYVKDESGKGVMKNPLLEGKSVLLKADDFSAGTSLVPFKWKIEIPPLQTSYEMKFVSGFLGISQDTENLMLKTEIDWAVLDDQIPFDIPAEFKNYMSRGNK